MEIIFDGVRAELPDFIAGLAAALFFAFVAKRVTVFSLFGRVNLGSDNSDCQHCVNQFHE
jgi:hypothetical protein